ncbi:hypothetical protein Taro_045435, partial [Colocasia esculenta]|nr:hypothetical protein [Colocasia esculenta]
GLTSAFVGGKGVAVGRSLASIDLAHFRLPTGARGEIVVRVAVTDRAGIDGSDGGSCEKLLGVQRESSAVEPARFQFSQCAPEGVAHYATDSCVLYRL